MAVAKKTSKTRSASPSKKPTTKKQSTKEGSSFFESLRKLETSAGKAYRENQGRYNLYAFIVIALALVFTFFWFNKSLIVAGNINGEWLSTPAFYSRLTKETGDDVFETIVRETLIKQEADKKAVSVSEDEVNARLSEIEKSLGGKEQLDQALQARNTSLDEVKKQINIQLLSEKLMEDRTSVTDEEIDKYIAENQSAKDKPREEVKEDLKAQKASEAFPAFYEELKAKAKISRYF